MLNKGKLMKASLIKFITISICSSLIACSSDSGESSPEIVAKKFVEKSYQGDADAVISMIYLSSKDKEQAGVKEMVDGKVKAGVAQEKNKAEERGGVSEITVGTFEPSPNSDNRGKVAVEIKFKQGNNIKNNVKVIRTENGDWKIAI